MGAAHRGLYQYTEVLKAEQQETEVLVVSLPQEAQLLTQ